MSTASADISTASPLLPSVPSPSDGLGVLLDLALEATAATGAALFLPEGDELRVMTARGANAPAPDLVLPLEGSVAGEAWYRGRLVIGAEPPPRGRQVALWQDDRTIDVMAVPVLVADRPVAAFVLYHRHLGHFRRGDATTLSRLAVLAGGLWGGGAGLQPVADGRARQEIRAAARAALIGSARLSEEEAAGELVRTAAALFDGAAVRLSTLEGEELVCQACAGRLSGDIGRRRPRSFGIEGMALEAIDGVLASEWTPEGGGSGGWMRSVLAVPLRRVDQVLGVLTLAHAEPGHFQEVDRESLLRFAIHATATLSEIRLSLTGERQLTDGRAASQVAAALATAEDTPALRRTIVREAARALAADGAELLEVVQQHLALTAADGDHVALETPPLSGGRLRCGHEFPPHEVAHRCSLPAGQGHLLVTRLGQVTGCAGMLMLLRRGAAFTALDQELLHRVAEIAELALLSRLSNVRVSQYADRIRSVAEVSASLHQSLRPGDAMLQAAEMLRRALGIGTVRVAQVDEVWQEIRFPVDRRGEEIRDGGMRPLARGLLEEVWRTGHTFYYPANALEELAARGLSVDTRPRCLAAVPLRTRGTITGVITIEEEDRDHAFEAEDVRILEIVAQQLGVTLENLDSLEEERRQRITAEWLRQMARAATDEEARPGRVLELAADAAFQGISGVAALVSSLAGDATRVVVASRGPLTPGLADPLPLAGSVDGWMREEQGAVFISANLSQDPRLAAEAQAAAGAVALAAVPIWCEGRLIAVLQLARPAGAAFAVAEVERLAQIADHAGAGYQTAAAGQALRKSEERYRRLFSAATDAIFTLDRAGTILSFNQSAERLWNVRSRAAVGRPWDEVLAFEDLTTVGEQFRRTLAGESSVFETAVRRPSGERGVVAITVSPLVEEGQVTTVLGIVRDVTDQRRVQAQLLQAEKMSAIGQLVGGMAHEINNPLASILVNMELLVGEAKDPAQLESLQAIKVEADRAAQIVRNLLTYVRGQGSERAVVDLREAVRGALALRRNQLLSQQIEVSAELPEEAVLVWGNTINLQQVLMNLLVNAEQAIRGSRGRGHVWVRLAAREQLATITVDDDGPGIPAEFISRIFDPFYTTKPEGEGTGLGLSVSAGIIADHNGKIAASERTGGGARFLVELPLSQARPAVAAVQDRPRPPLPAAPAGARRGRILLVDDEPDIRRSISKFLTRTGWQVDLADSGEEGLRLLEEGEYDVVLCDLRMPGMSGHEFYRHLQADEAPAVQRLIFMTGDVLSPEASRFLAEARRPVLSKPFALRDLMEVLALVVPG
ncbi:MAG: GAF domain-containing protein [Gemmatimonadetes bacterium]|nr:GAF domain-containing protein [Gemmatimonadota bacterium]